MRTKIKICGLTSPEEAALLDPSHVDAAGMVLFCPKSKRNITIERAVEIMKALPKGIKKVAVTVSPTVEEAGLAEKAGFDFLQVHGTMERDFVIHGGLPIIRAVNILEKIPVFEEHERIKAYLFDAATPGSGKTFDWQCLAKIPRDGRKFILAGGLTPFNVGQAIRTVHPYMVDVSSRVEYADRKGKDPAKVASFIQAVEKEDLRESL